MKEEIIYLQNMISPRDILLVSNELERLGMQVKEIELGTASFMSSGKVGQEELARALKDVGYRLVQKEEKDFVEQVKMLLTEYLDQLCQHKEQVPLMSAFLEDRMNIPYSSISKRFRKIEERTVENYLIFLKVSKVKKLINSTNLDIPAIARCLNYSSPGSLARVFREVTGFSVYDFKNKEKGAYRMAAGF